MLLLARPEMNRLFSIFVCMKYTQFSKKYKCTQFTKKYINETRSYKWKSFAKEFPTTPGYLETDWFFWNIFKIFSYYLFLTENHYLKFLKTLRNTKVIIIFLQFIIQSLLFIPLQF